MMIHAYKSFNRKCREESQVTQESIDGFNNGEDFNKLPDDRALKCYMLCQMLEMEMMEPGVPTVKMDIVVENIRTFSDRDKDIFLNMGKRCTRLKSKTKDSCDMAYDFNKCTKKGDINVCPILMMILNFNYYILFDQMILCIVYFKWITSFRFRVISFSRNSNEIQQNPNRNVEWNQISLRI